MTRVYLGLGSNSGDKESMITKAISRLEQYGSIDAVSPLYATEPFGVLDQEWFLNGVCAFSTNLSPYELLDAIVEIETALGRVRTIKNGPRTIDIDILLWDDEVVSTERLQIPHPGIQSRWCVLKPLVDIAPDVMHPLLHKTAFELLAEISSTDALGKEYTI